MAFGGIGIPLSLKSLSSNAFALLAGETMLIPPGQWVIDAGPNVFVQVLDPISNLTGVQTWRSVLQPWNGAPMRIMSDGANFRVANLTGTPVGAVVTNAGSGYTSSPTITPSAGASSWRAVVGGLINTSVTIPGAALRGANYTYPPICFIPAPPTGGIQATATAGLSAGTVNAVTITNQGGGYTTAPNLYFISDARDPNNPLTNPNTTTPITPAGTITTLPQVPGSNNVGSYPAGLALTGSGTLAGVIVTDPGNTLTALPTLAFSGGGGASAAATVLMNWTVTGFTVVGGGTGYGNAQPFAVRTITGVNTSATAANTNPAIEKGITQLRPALISGTSTAGGAVTATASIVQDPGIGFQAVPLMVVDFGGTGAIAPPTVWAAVTATVGGTNDFVYMYPADA